MGKTVVSLGSEEDGLSLFWSFIDEATTIIKSLEEE
jgi:hypothetical protein